MTDAVRLVALNLALALVGVGAIHLAGMPLARRLLPTILGLAPATGLALGGLVATVGAMAGLDVAWPSTFALATVVLGAGYLMKRRRQPVPIPHAPSHRGPVDRAVELAALVGLAALSIGIVRLAIATNLGPWDGWAIWAPKAHALFVDGDVWGPVFREPVYLSQHQEYPILLPALEALSANTLGRFDPRLIDVEAAAVLVSFGWGSWALLRLVVPPAISAVAAFALTASAPLAPNAAANYADAVVASFTALALLCLVVWLARGMVTTLVLAGVFLAAAASVKAEGLVFAVAALMAAGIAARSFGRRVRPVAVLGSIALVVPVTWMVVDRLNGPGPDNIDRRAFVNLAYIGEALDRIPVAAQRLVVEIASDWSLASLAVLIAFSATLLVRAWRYVLFAGVWGALAFAGLVSIYYAGTPPIDWYLTTSADRVISSLVLGLATIAPVLAVRAWEEARSRDPSLTP